MNAYGSILKEEKQMVAVIKKYNSVEEIAESLDEKISQTKSNLGELLRKLDEIRKLAETSQKIREIVMKSSGKKNEVNEGLGEIEVGNIKIVLDANPSQQMTAIESAVKSHQERLLVLQQARQGLKPLEQLGSTEGLEFIVLEKQMLPELVMLKTS